VHRDRAQGNRSKALVQGVLAPQRLQTRHDTPRLAIGRAPHKLLTCLRRVDWEQAEPASSAPLRPRFALEKNLADEFTENMTLSRP
jgi:hypothetical protein